MQSPWCRTAVAVCGFGGSSRAHTCPRATHPRGEQGSDPAFAAGSLEDFAHVPQAALVGEGGISGQNTAKQARESTAFITDEGCRDCIWCPSGPSSLCSAPKAQPVPLCAGSWEPGAIPRAAPRAACLRLIRGHRRPEISFPSVLGLRFLNHLALSAITVPHLRVRTGVFKAEEAFLHVRQRSDNC